MEEHYTAEQFLERYKEERPHLFDCTFKEINLLLMCGSENYEKWRLANEKELNDYFSTEELHIATAIITDFGIETAKRIGKIIVAATE